jgi:uncharacterized membrane protein
MTWIGGMAFMVFVLMPTLRKSVAPEERTRLLRGTALRFRSLGWFALGTMVLTGIGNLWFRDISPAEFVAGKAFRMGDWGRTLAEKLAVVAVILVASATHDFWIGPRTLRLAESPTCHPERSEGPSRGRGLEGQSASRERERFRRIASWAGRLTFVLALVVVALAVQLVR